MSGWTAVSLPYRGGKLDMVALLPPSGAATCAMPAAAALGTMTATLTGPGTAAGLSTGTIALPKVNLSTRVSLRGLLTRLGIAFVEHAATLQVGEKGTVASAATAVGFLPADLPGNLVVFDRPYLLLVTDTGTGEPLLLARVADPAAR